jgi:4-amino-4-deoxy-L-arabinose transferase-like glycosyltransferase
MSTPKIKLLNLKKRFHLLILSLLFLAVALPGLGSLQVIDRDEARFAQASVQMEESGDLLNIRFQDEARNKKPAGIYWLQVASLKVFSSPEKRQIWVQRLPSVLGALLAVLATYWGGAKLIGREGAFIGGCALALSFLLVFEAHIAKTDAVLCGLSATCFAAIAAIRSQPGLLSLWKARPSVWAFWIAFGASILIKGPVIPSLIALTLATLLIWEKRGYGLRQLINIPAITAALLLFVPWAIAIGIETQGAFFAESLGNDFGGKLVSAQESHPGPPGYHLALLSLTLWPGSLLLLPAIALTVRNLRQNMRSDAPLSKALRLCVAWSVPFLILIELMPTKLPHYVLPIFPALCVLIGLAGLHLLKTSELKKTRVASGLVFIVLGVCLVIFVVMGYKEYSSQTGDFISSFIGTLSLALILIGGAHFWFNNIKLSYINAAVATLALNIAAYGTILPNLDRLQLADSLAASFEANDINLPRQGGPLVQALNFTEPSLVYQFGKEIRLGDQIDLSSSESWKIGNIFIVDDLESEGDSFEIFQKAAKNKESCLEERDVINGYNYSRGDAVNLHIIEVVSCPEE